MLRLLECYVLWEIGKLGTKEAEALEEMEPKLRQLFNEQGNWREIVARVMALPANMQDLIRMKWKENLEIAKQQSLTLEPQRFAEMFVDSNLAE